MPLLNGREVAEEEKELSQQLLVEGAVFLKWQRDELKLENERLRKLLVDTWVTAAAYADSGMSPFMLDHKMKEYFRKNNVELPNG